MPKTDDHGQPQSAGIFYENEPIRNQLLLADAGYVDFNYFSQLSEHGGSFIVRGKNLNPVIIEARNCRATTTQTRG